MEEDYRLFQLVKRNPINSCADLSKNMRGKRNGVFYFTESFRVDFEKRMYELGRAVEENENLKQAIKINKDLYETKCNKNKELEEENRKLNNANKTYINAIQNITPVLMNDYVDKSLIKEKIEETANKVKELEPYKHISPHDYGYACGKNEGLRELLEDKQ